MTSMAMQEARRQVQEDFRAEFEFLADLPLEEYDDYHDRKARIMELDVSTLDWAVSVVRENLEARP